MVKVLLGVNMVFSFFLSASQHFTIYTGHGELTQAQTYSTLLHLPQTLHDCGVLNYLDCSASQSLNRRELSHSGYLPMTASSLQYIFQYFIQSALKMSQGMKKLGKMFCSQLELLVRKCFQLLSQNPFFFFNFMPQVLVAVSCFRV